ncbi:MAG: DUF2225 domain-containing protein [Deltaproteobacteria bacterium]|nr:DUF2225 domain-containing protein [Deltaproteobacteria bacterium]
MSTIQPRSITCPYCTASFEGWLVLAGSSRGPKSTDLRNFDPGEDPLPKQINACPGCGWVGEVSDFEELAPAPNRAVGAKDGGAYFSQDDWDDANDPLLIDGPPRSASTISEQIAAHLTPRAADAVASPALRYELHAQVQRWRGEGPLREGDAWLRATWLHGDAEREDDARRCRTLALGSYLRGITERRWFKRREDLVVIAYLCGELNRRLGDSAEAGRWFEQATAWSSGLPHMQELVELAERQGREPRDVV